MKSVKKLFLISVSVIIASMIILYSCKSYTGPGRRNIFDEDDGNYTLPPHYLSQEQQYSPMKPDSQAVVLFTNECIIPALTISSRGTLIAAVGCGTTPGKLIGKRSSDFGKTWTEFTFISDSDFNDSHVHPFFINDYNGNILLGLATTNETKNTATIYRSTTDGVSWTKENINNLTLTDIKSKNGVTTKHAFVNYGQGVTLRHGTNKGLIFPYTYKAENKNGSLAATMISFDNGKTWSQYGEDLGDFTMHEVKFVEIADGKILANFRRNNNLYQEFWASSSDMGSNWSQAAANWGQETDYTSHVDFVRYEFNGKDIKSGGAKYALTVFSYKNKNQYSVGLSLNDFNSGSGTHGTKYTYEQVVASNVSSSANAADIYPAITVLPDGTIATLAAESNNITFRRFNLSWLTSTTDGQDGEEYVDYDIDNVLK